MASDDDDFPISDLFVDGMKLLEPGSVHISQEAMRPFKQGAESGCVIP